MNSKTKKIFYGLSIVMFLLFGIAIAFFWKSRSKADTFKLYFNPNGGTGEMAAQNVDFGKKYPLTRGSFTAPEGKEFVGWFSTIDKKQFVAQAYRDDTYKATFAPGIRHFFVDSNGNYLAEGSEVEFNINDAFYNLY